MNAKIILVIGLFVFSVMCETEAQVAEQWARRYNGPGNSNDRANAIALDDSGNVYVTGYSHGGLTVNDYATIKYNSSGDTLWVERYNGPANLSDQATAMAIDGSGNVYVTGSSVGIGTQGDYCTIKYNSSGDSLWVARYNGPGNGGDIANSIAVDANGNVYVTGKADRIAGVIWDFATIKYNSSGDRQWVARYSPDTTALKNSSAISVKVDELGNVYVAGTAVFGTGTNGDYATVKYNSTGDLLWARMYEGPANVENVSAGPWSLAVDSSGNAYVTGFSSDGVSFDYATLKYDTSGAALWAARYDGPGNNADYARSVAIDASGNVYVTGDSRGNGTGIDYATIKYNSSGDSLWVARYNGPGNGSDFGKSLAVDDLGNVYVTGKSVGSGTQDDYSTIKYNLSGDSTWVMRYNGPNNTFDEPYALAVDKAGNVYVTGWSTGTGTSLDYATIKYGAVNNAPTAFSLLEPAAGDTLDLVFPAVPVEFRWSSSNDADFGDTVRYEFRLTGSNVDTTISGLKDTTTVLDIMSQLQLATTYQWYVLASDGKVATNSDTLEFSTSDNVVSVESAAGIPEKYDLYQNFPNPFNPGTTVLFDLPNESRVELKVYDILGREVTTLVNETISAGRHRLYWNAAGVASGIYFYRLEAHQSDTGQGASFVETKKLLLLR